MKDLFCYKMVLAKFANNTQDLSLTVINVVVCVGLTLALAIKFFLKMESVIYATKISTHLTIEDTVSNLRYATIDNIEIQLPKPA